MTSNRISSDADLDRAELPAARTLTRRAALLRVVALPFAAAVGTELAACSKGPKCDDTSGLSPDDAKIRTEVAAYQEQAPDQTKRCALCLQFNSAGDKACGTCKVVKGPINPGGYCKLFQAKPA